MKWYAMGLLFVTTLSTAQIADHVSRSPSVGQNIGGGIHTLCHDSDRLYVSANGLAVVHDDSTCHTSR